MNMEKRVLLQVINLKKYFPVSKGLFTNRQVRFVKAVTMSLMFAMVRSGAGGRDYKDYGCRTIPLSPNRVR